MPGLTVVTKELTLLLSGCIYAKCCSPAAAGCCSPVLVAALQQLAARDRAGRIVRSVRLASAALCQPHVDLRLREVGAGMRVEHLVVAPAQQLLQHTAAISVSACGTAQGFQTSMHTSGTMKNIHNRDIVSLRMHMIIMQGSHP